MASGSEDTINIKKQKDFSDDESESDSEDGEFDPEILESDINFPALIGHFFTNEDGQNIAQILTDMKKSLDTHNKLIFKLLKSEKDGKK